MAFKPEHGNRTHGTSNAKTLVDLSAYCCPMNTVYRLQAPPLFLAGGSLERRSIVRHDSEKVPITWRPYGSQYLF